MLYFFHDKHLQPQSQWTSFGAFLWILLAFCGTFNSPRFIGGHVDMILRRTCLRIMQGDPLSLWCLESLLVCLSEFTTVLLIAS